MAERLAAQIGDRERTQMQETGEVLLHGSVPVGEIVQLIDDLGLDPNEIRIEARGSMFGDAARPGTAVCVRTQKP